MGVGKEERGVGKEEGERGGGMDGREEGIDGGRGRGERGAVTEEVGCIISI